ncbi:MAG: AhpC/TSA family protein [Tannerella sp.]|jgi:peroxiredoxin|nr:AhpC/TSA family protein [Tannerella sp.]
MRNKLLNVLMLTCGLWMAIACRQAPVFVVKGTVTGAEGQTVYFENVGLSAVTLMDSVKLKSSGEFTFKKQRPEYPDFYRLRLKNQWINLAIDSTETVTVKADSANFATSYTVEGSDNCIVIKEITLAQLEANREYRQLRKDFEAKSIADTTYQRKSTEVIDRYKTLALKYIYGQPMSTAAYFALFQKIDGLLFFDPYNRTDSRAYGAVATSLSNRFPESPRAMQLTNVALQSLKVIRNEQLLDSNLIDTKEIDFLEIELPNVANQKIKLSEVSKGNVVILNFTAYQSEFSTQLNEILENIYARNHRKGLEIYQVSLDSDLHLWKNVALNFSWICVHDPQTVYSQAAALYNVKQLPAIFVFDRKGLIVKRIEDINGIESEISKLL